MKRLIEECGPTEQALAQLLASAEPYQSSPFAKRHVYSRLLRRLEAPPMRLAGRSLLLATGGLLIAATAAAAGYSFLAPSPAPLTDVPSPVVEAPSPRRSIPQAAPPAAPASATIEKKDDKPAERRVEKPRVAGEDPTQVAEAVRALRKQGDPARAQALLDHYLRSNPRGALAEDALALSIEAAAARRDPRAADYARRYLARYPQGRFRAVAERALGKP